MALIRQQYNVNKRRLETNIFREGSGVERGFVIIGTPNCLTLRKDNKIKNAGDSDI